MTDRLTIPVRLGYGIGDIAFNLLWTSLSLYLLFYYTDVLSISPAVAGAIIMAGMVWDGITDPLMGLVADRTRSRWGRYRPYFLFGALPLSASFILMFATPWIGAGSIVFAAAASQILFRTVYTALAIPFTALSARLTSDSMERNKLTSIRMVCATLGGLFVARFTLEFAQLFGDGDMQIGFLKVAILYAALATPIFWTTFLATHEKAEPDVQVKAPSFKMTLLMLRENWAFLLLFAAVMAASSGGTLVTKALVYYLIYAAGADVATIGEVLAIFVGTITLSVPIWAWITEKTSKRFVWLVGAAISVGALLIFCLVAPTTIKGILGIMVVHSFGYGAFILTFWSMLPDTVEFGEWKSGIRGESIVFGLITLSQKVALGVGVGFLGIMLGWVGYVPNVAQSAETLEGILRIMTLIPVGLLLIGAALIFFYPISKTFHETILREIEANSAKSDVTQND